MNPLIKKTVDRINQHVKLTEGDKIYVTIEVGRAIVEALNSAEANPKYNLKGGDNVDENTIGNFKTKSIYDGMFSNCKFDSHTLKIDFSDWDVENPEDIELCCKCGMPKGDGVRSKECKSAWYICLCNLKY